ncbi:MAG: NUDIX domain-containing protein [Chloroflexota bacterium]
MGHTDQGIQAGRDRYQAIPRVLLFLRNGGDVLLLKGSPSKRIWANCYNGVGGHVERGEDPLTAAHRELWEETGLDGVALRLVAVVNVDANDTKTGILMFVFTGWSEQRETRDSAEGELQWVAAEAVDQLPLVEDLPWLLPRILERPAAAPPLFLHYSYDAEDRLVIRPADAHRRGADGAERIRRLKVES